MVRSVLVSFRIDISFDQTYRQFSGLDWKPKCAIDGRLLCPIVQGNSVLLYLMCWWHLSYCIKHSIKKHYIWHYATWINHVLQLNNCYFIPNVSLVWSIQMQLSLQVKICAHTVPQFFHSLHHHHCYKVTMPSAVGTTKGKYVVNGFPNPFIDT